jgi:hypothetical protein
MSKIEPTCSVQYLSVSLRIQAVKAVDIRVLYAINSIWFTHVIENKINRTRSDEKPVGGVKNSLATKIPNVELNYWLFFE